MKIQRKRSQEEMIGFVLIIVLIAVIALIFLALSIRKTSTIGENRDVENFLHSSLLYTTECKPSPEITYDLKDLIAACYNNEKCQEDNACYILNSTFTWLIENSFKIGQEYKAYELKIYKENDTILYLNKGNYTNNKRGSMVLVPVSGENMKIELRMYY